MSARKDYRPEVLRMYDLFMSYHSLDHVAVEAIARLLRERGIKPFLDRWYLVPGRSWLGALEKVLGDCKAVAIFIGPQGMGRWQQRERATALDRQTRDEDFLVIPILLPGADPALGFLSLNMWIDLRNGMTDDAIDTLVAAVRRDAMADEIKERVASAPPSICPFRGLRSFREEDEPFFCGRETFTGILESAARKHDIIAVVGASGSGKSSVVRAGLIPRLRRNRDCVWDVVVALPQERPFHSIAASFLPLIEPELSEVDRLREVEKLAIALATGEVQLRSLVHRTLEKQPGTDRVLLFVDQWEELYTLCRDEAIRHNFISQLLDVIASEKMSLVLTLRGDFYGHALADRRLSDRLQGRVVNIGPMTRDELISAIRQPAERAGLRFEDGLVARILDDVGDEPGALPLLEFLLSELWEKRHKGGLMHDAYTAIGGVRRAIAERAEQAFARLSEHEQEAAHWALLALVVPGEGAEDTRRRAQMQELDAVARNVIAKLASDRLLVTARDATGKEIVEVGHEALIREWKRLREWVDENRDFLRTLRRLDEEVEFWKATNHDPDLLIPAGRRLVEAQHLLNARPKAVGGGVRAYVTASVIADQERKDKTKLDERLKLRRTRQFAASVSVLLFLASGLLAFSVYEYTAAARSKDEAEARFDLALKLATTLVGKTGERRKDGGLRTRAARELLAIADDALGDLSRLKSDPQDKQEIASRQVTLLLTVADSYSGIDSNKELMHAKAGKELAQQLVYSQPSSEEWNRLLYASSFRLGDALDSQGRLQLAHAEYQTAQDVVDRFYPHPSDAVDWPIRKVFIRGKIGDSYKRQENLAMSRQHYDLALSIADKLVNVDPPHKSDPLKKEARHLWSASLSRIGDILVLQADFEGAFEQYKNAMQISKQLAELDPSPVRKVALAVCHSRLGTVLVKLKRLGDALAQFGKALEIKMRLVEVDETNASYSDYLASSYADLGDVRKESDLNGALEEYSRALALRERLVSMDPDNKAWQDKLVALRSSLDDVFVDRYLEQARVFQVKGKLDKAIEQYRQALARAESSSQGGSKSAAAKVQSVRVALDTALTMQERSTQQNEGAQDSKELDHLPTTIISPD